MISMTGTQWFGSYLKVRRILDSFKYSDDFNLKRVTDKLVQEPFRARYASQDSGRA